MVSLRSSSAQAAEVASSFHKGRFATNQGLGQNKIIVIMPEATRWNNPRARPAKHKASCIVVASLKGFLNRLIIT
jgi:hypothetical protein